MNVNIIGVPMYYGADKKGPEYGPDKLREKKIQGLIRQHGHVVYDMGNLYVPEVKEYNKYFSHPNMKYLDAIIEVNTNLAHSVYASHQSGSFPLIVGGDHALGLGSISGSSRAHKNLAVIWMDAHGDINTQETSSSGNVHGMPLAKAMGIGYEDLANVYFDGVKVPKENVFIVGARDLDDGEVELIEKENLNVITADEIHAKGIETVWEEIQAKLTAQGVEAIHLSFDLDFIDSAFVPGTGTPVPGGMDVAQTKYMLKSIASTGLVKAMDFVELNVLLDRNDTTAELAADLINWTFKHL